MRALLRELAPSAHACALDSAVVNAKMRLDELATTIMSAPSPAEFAALRDELTELMLELPAEQRHTPSQIYHVYESTFARLNMPCLSFQAKNLLTSEQKRTFDHEAYGEAIKQVLSEHHLEDQQRAISNRAATKRPRPPPQPPSLPRIAQLVATPAAHTCQCAASAASEGTRPTRAGTTPMRRRVRRGTRRSADASQQTKANPPTIAAATASRRARQPPPPPPLLGHSHPKERMPRSPMRRAPSPTTQPRTAYATRPWG